jgi:hypothetical protein
MADTGAPMNEDIEETVANAIKEFAQPDADLGWVGSNEVELHASEIASFLMERGLLR